MNPSTSNARKRMASWGLVLAAAGWIVPTDGPVTNRLATTCQGAWGELDSVRGRTTRIRCIPRGAIVEPIRGPARWLVGESIDLNQASLETLQVLPGIGPERAQRIVQARCSGRLTDLKGLLEIHGIGAKTVARLQGQVFVGEGAVPRKECLGSSTLRP